MNGNLPSQDKITGGRRQKKPGGISGGEFPLVSVITPVLNARGTIKSNIETFECQTYPFKEHIIIDGGSTDGTLDILTENDNHIDYWLSQKDNGIYDAMNKGIDVAQGEWIYFLGADDYFYRHDTLASVMEKALAASDAALVFGNIIYPDGKIFCSKLDRKIYYKNTIHHQSAFYRRRTLENFRFGQAGSPGSGKNFKISGDYQLNLRLFVEREKHIYIDQIIAGCARGVSTKGKLTGYLEEIAIRRLYMNFFQAVFFDILTLMRYGWKKIDFRNYRKF